MFTLDQILVSLKRYLDCKLDSEMMKDIHVVLDSVKKEKETGKGDLVITLLRVEEETSRKPQNSYFYRVEDDVQLRTSPDLDINLEILISAPTSEYETALTLIAKVISIMNSIKTIGKPAGLEDEDFEIIDSMNISLMGMSFDQMLSMWQTLGGTVVPAVAYKIRMLTVPGLYGSGRVPLVEKDRIQIGMERKDTGRKGAKSPKKEEKSKEKSAKTVQIREK